MVAIQPFFHLKGWAVGPVWKLQAGWSVIHAQLKSQGLLLPVDTVWAFVARAVISQKLACAS
jgi:hypothetical protein